MDSARLARLAASLARPEIAALDPARLGALARALDEPDPPVRAGRHGSLVGYEPGPGGRRLIELDRRDQLIAFLSWRDSGHEGSGGLAWARCRATDGRWLGIEPGGGSHPAWPRADRVWELDGSAPWRPLAPVTVFEALDYERVDRIPPLAEPRKLGAGAGTAILNLLAGLMKDQGIARVRYSGPYPSESLFTALLESFRYDPGAASPIEQFLAGEPLDWLPAPHERHEVAPGVWVQMRHEVEKVVLAGAPFYRRDWQGVERQEPRVVRADGRRLVCSLWALDQSIEDRLVLTIDGEIVSAPAPKRDPRPPAPLAPLWRTALGALIARESAPPLAPVVASVMAGLALEWGPVPGDLLAADGARYRISWRLRDTGADWIGAAPEAERAQRAAALILEVAHLLAPAVRLRAQMALEALPEAEQKRRWEEAASAAPPPLDASVGRLIALVTRGQG